MTDYKFNRVYSFRKYLRYVLETPFGVTHIHHEMLTPRYTNNKY